MTTPIYKIMRDIGGHFLVTAGETQKPVALFYAHNVSDRVARRRAERFISRSQRAPKEKP